MASYTDPKKPDNLKLFLITKVESNIKKHFDPQLCLLN